MVADALSSRPDYIGKTGKFVHFNVTAGALLSTALLFGINDPLAPTFVYTAHITYCMIRTTAFSLNIKHI